MLGLEGRINAILALECNCSTADALPEVRAELSAILPGTRIIEKGSKALARAEARQLVAAGGKAEVARVREGRLRLRQDREQLAAVIVPAVAILSLFFVGYLTFLNVRQRVGEIGILRAFGVTSPRILGLFMVRALVMGVLGAVVGEGALQVAWLASGRAGWSAYGLVEVLPVLHQVLLLLCTPLLAGAAAWLPALAAARSEPATILRHD
jgi:cell division protein FtsX